eukprot:3066188-Rhodomonas_salina.2
MYAARTDPYILSSTPRQHNLQNAYARSHLFNMTMHVAAISSRNARVCTSTLFDLNTKQSTALHAQQTHQQIVERNKETSGHSHRRWPSTTFPACTFVAKPTSELSLSSSRSRSRPQSRSRSPPPPSSAACMHAPTANRTRAGRSPVGDVGVDLPLRRRDVGRHEPDRIEGGDDREDEPHSQPPDQRNAVEATVLKDVVFADRHHLWRPGPEPVHVRRELGLDVLVHVSRAVQIVVTRADRRKDQD